MNTLETWRPLIEVLGWTLIHFTWQGTLVALSLAGVLRLLRGASTNARYAAACVALLLMLAAPVATLTLISLSAPDKSASGAPSVFTAQQISEPLPIEIKPTIAPTQTVVATASPRPWSSLQSVSLVGLLPWMILLWLSGVIFFSLRLVGGWLYTQRLKSHRTCPLDDKWRQTLRRLCGQLSVRRPVRLLESALANVPMVIGWLRPVILLPASALTGLTPQQLEAIIAHELAHIRRHDYLINLLQALIETLLFYHPAVWWVSRRIRQEREHCCDDLAVAVCGDELTYARALLEMEQLRADGPQLAMAANGGLLMNRIQRLVGAQTQHTNRFTGLFAGIIALTSVVSVGAVAQIMLRSSDQQVVSVRKREARQVKSSDETSGEQVREAAAKSLGIIGDRRALEPLSQALQDADEQVRKKAAEALALLKQSGGDSSMALLRKPFGEQGGIAPDQTVNQQGAAADLIRLYDEQKEGRLKVRVIIALARLNDEQARAKLSQITRSENHFYLRERAMDELARGSSADDLSRLYDEQKDDRLKERVIIALARVNNERARSKLSEITRSEERFYLRERAMDELARGSSADDLSRLYDEQKDDRLKERVIIALARVNSELARVKLGEITRSEERSYLRERAMTELAQGISVGQAQPVVR